MPRLTPNFPAHASRDVWQDGWLSPRRSLFRCTQPGAAAHDRTPAVPALSATVKLGAVTEDGRFHRWLTHDEIAGAVLSAIDEGRDIVAGTLPG